MRKRDHSLVVSAASLLVCGVLTGIVVAAAAFPAVALAGLAAKAGAEEFGKLPTELNVRPSPQNTYVYAKDNKTLLAIFYDENRHDIPLSEIPKVMQNAILAAEDERFYRHRGVDFQGIVRAFIANQQGGTTQGASTLTMQYVRQVITYSATSPAEIIAATERTNARKLREMRLAMAVESVMTKDEILEAYLNIVPFGERAYGVYAASQVYFNKEPKDLTLDEAALLAALPKAPTAFNPVTEEGKPKAKERRDHILNTMAELGMISRDEAEAAKQKPINVVGRQTPNGCIATPVAHWGFFCDFFRRWWIQQPAFGANEAEREVKLKTGGYRVVTSLDPKIQASAKKHVETELPTSPTQSDALMVVAIEPGTGYVRAMAVNRNFGLNDSKNGPSSDPNKRRKGIKGTYPTTTNPLMSGGGDISGYKAGSTFKIFTMLAALEQGYPLDFQIVATSPYRSKYIVGTNDISACADRVHWCPQNADPRMNGRRNMWTGFGMSVNTYFVPLLEKVGADAAIDMAKRLGIHFRSSNDIKFTSEDRAAGFGPFTLGVTDTVPLELANAYATLAADGKYCEPLPAVEIYDRNGRKLEDVTAPRCRQVIRPEVAHAAIDAARCPIRDPGGLGRCAGAATTGFYFTDAQGRGFRSAAQAVGHPVFGKTGTSDNNWTANLVISTKHLAVAATLADPERAEKPHDATYPQKVNRVAVHTMRDAVKDLPKIDFPKPPDNLVFGKRVNIPNVTCQPVNTARSRLINAGFDVSISDEAVPSKCPANTVARTDPSGSTSKGSTVVIYVSSGAPTEQATPPPGEGPGGPGGGDGGGDGGGGGGPGRGGGGGGPGIGLPVLPRLPGIDGED